MKKGERTRIEILEATLKVMVTSGVHGITFRRVAETADIKTSLVAYHFPERTQLLRDAVSMLFSRQSVYIDRIFKNLYKILDQYSSRDFRRAITRAEIALQLTDEVTDILFNYYLSSQIDPRCLLILKFDTHPDPALIHVRNLANRSLNVYLTELSRRLNSTTPNLDARLISSVFTLFELESIKNDIRDKKKVHETLWQTLSKILNVSGNLNEVIDKVRKRNTPSYKTLLSQGDLFITG